MRAPTHSPTRPSPVRFRVHAPYPPSITAFAVVDRLRDFGVDVRDVRISATPTAHAIVMVDHAGENQIVIYPGANMEQDARSIAEALENAGSDDWLMLQNETSHQAEAAELAQEKGMRVAYSAAPFDVAAVEAVLPFVTVLIMNEVEATAIEFGA